MPTPYFIQPFVDKGLGNSTYLVGSDETKTGVLIDPLRDVDRYLHAAAERGIRLTHVLDTHLHADFVSGNRELAHQAGARIGASAEAGLEFDHDRLTEETVIDLGAFRLQVMGTPGHSPEHISFLLVGPEGGTASAVFSGGALIVGGAARTDLLGEELTHPLARRLYETIHQKLMKLPDEMEVFPTHGAGSFCVAPVSSERTTTIGHERRTNPLVLAGSEQEFIERALLGLPSYPTYYKYMRGVNREGPPVLGGVPVLQPLRASEVKASMADDVVVLDVRHNDAFGAGHIPSAYGIRVDAPLTTWAGWLIPFGSRIILVAESTDQVVEATRQLIRIGYDRLVGSLDGGMESWARAGYAVATIPAISVTDLRARLDEVTLLDVRQDSEWEAGHIPGAIHVEAGRIAREPLQLPVDKPLAIQCASGNRSMSVASVLRRRGYENIIQVQGGINKWKMHGFEITKGPPKRVDL